MKTLDEERQSFEILYPFGSNQWSGPAHIPVFDCRRPQRSNPVCPCPRAIVAIVERLLLTCASSPIARPLAGQLPECRSEGGLRGIAKRGCDRHDRVVGVAQHFHSLLKLVLA